MMMRIPRVKVYRTRRRGSFAELHFTFTVPPAMARKVAAERRRIMSEVRR